MHSYDFTLKKVIWPGEGSKSYVYDRVGNRKIVTRIGANPPTVIELSSLSARGTMSGVVIEWVTAAEIKTVGYHLFRKAKRDNKYEKITSFLIPAKGTPVSGASYTYLDVPSRGLRKWQYLLEEVDTSGKTRQYGPVSVENTAFMKRSNGKVFKKSFNGVCD